LESPVGTIEHRVIINGEVRWMQWINDEQHNLVLNISDNGRGLPADFDLKNTKTLGLKLVKNLINQLRGELQIDSSLGTKFKITLTRIKVNK
jgi:two-component sensor histidine kinase